MILGRSVRRTPVAAATVSRLGHASPNLLAYPAIAARTSHWRPVKRAAKARSIGIRANRSNQYSPTARVAGMAFASGKKPCVSGPNCERVRLPDFDLSAHTGRLESPKFQLRGFVVSVRRLRLC